MQARIDQMPRWSILAALSCVLIATPANAQQYSYQAAPHLVALEAVVDAGTDRVARPGDVLFR